jgi:hypothetical protein
VTPRAEVPQVALGHFLDRVEFPVDDDVHSVEQEAPVSR